MVDSGQPGGSLRSAALAGGALLCSLCIEAVAAAAVYCHRCFTSCGSSEGCEAKQVAVAVAATTMAALALV